MTTIAWKDNILACDTQVTSDDTKYLCDNKITIISKNLVIACSGNTGDIVKLEKFFRSYPEWERYLDFKPKVTKALDAILISKGKPYTIFKDDYPDPLGHPFIACGSGWKFAMAGMHLGLSAVDAVKLASELDVNTNDRIKYLNVAELQGSSTKRATSKRTASPVQKEKEGTRNGDTKGT